MNKGKVRMPLGAWILCASFGLHGLAALALLAVGPLLAGPREPVTVPDHRVTAVAAETPDLLPIVPDEEPFPEWIHDPLPDPEAETPVEEPMEPEREYEYDEATGTLRLPDPAGAIGIGRGRLAGGRLRPRRPVREDPPPVRKPARMVARSGLRYSLKDVKGTEPGTLTFKVKLGTDGRVSDVVVRRRSGVVSFDDAMLASVGQWRFEPATVDGEAVASEIEISLRPARPRATVKPEYPPRAIDLGLEGVVLLAAVVGRDGSVTEVRVLESSGASLLDRAAIAAVKRWTFHPARINGHATPCTVEIRPIRFELRD